MLAADWEEMTGLLKLKEADREARLMLAAAAPAIVTERHTPEPVPPATLPTIEVSEAQTE